MEALLLATVATSAADSVNPFAITQQFVLQGLVKKSWHIWFFILPTGIVNWIGGFLAYYGLIGQLAAVAGSVFSRFEAFVRPGLVLLGFVFLLLAVYLFQKQIKNRNAGDNLEDAPNNPSGSGR